jgi:hypothetical protein
MCGHLRGKASASISIGDSMYSSVDEERAEGGALQYGATGFHYPT